MTKTIGEIRVRNKFFTKPAKQVVKYYEKNLIRHVKEFEKSIKYATTANKKIKAAQTISEVELKEAIDMLQKHSIPAERYWRFVNRWPFIQTITIYTV